jgi:hypothetical protein
MLGTINTFDRADKAKDEVYLAKLGETHDEGQIT